MYEPQRSNCYGIMGPEISHSHFAGLSGLGSCVHVLLCPYVLVACPDKHNLFRHVEIPIMWSGIRTLFGFTITGG
jgi:hypothetical protein